MILKAAGRSCVKHVAGGIFKWWSNGMPVEGDGSLPDPNGEEEEALVSRFLLGK